MKTNVKVALPPVRTHEGGKAGRTNPEQELRRSLMCCMLWEDTFYESGVTIAARIANLVPKVSPAMVASMAIEAREKMKLRHAPLWVVRAMAACASHKHLVATTLERVIQRPDELAEFVSLYWAGKRCPLSAQVKKGLARAFAKFDAFQLAKYDREGAVTLRDVLFLCHAKPKDGVRGYTKAARADGQEPPSPGSQIFKDLTDGNLETPDTWETSLSGGGGGGKTLEEKRATWERLLAEQKLGALALLRNLRNMEEADVNRGLIREALASMRTERVLPFRFIAAAHYAPGLEDVIEGAMLRCAGERAKLPGKTVLLLDVSGSMASAIGGKSVLSRMDAACGVGIMARELCEEVVVYSFSNATVQVPARRGFALRDAIVSSQAHGGTYLGRAMLQVNGKEKYDRVIVVTDEQTADAVPDPTGRGYIINVCAYQNGVGYRSKWVHIDGWSEAVLDYIAASEEGE